MDFEIRTGAPQTCDSEIRLLEGSGAIVVRCELFYDHANSGDEIAYTHKKDVCYPSGAYVSISWRD